MLSKLSESFGIPVDFLKEFALFVEYKDNEVTLNDSDYLLDILCFHDVRSMATQDHYNLSFKRRLWLSKPEDSLSDPPLLLFVFHQLKNSFLDGFLPVSLKDCPLASALLFRALQSDKDDSTLEYATFFCPCT